jgi:hypothetical protein
VPLHQLKKPHQLMLSLLWQTLNPFVINNFDRRVTSQQIKRKGKWNARIWREQLSSFWNVGERADFKLLDCRRSSQLLSIV